MKLKAIATAVAALALGATQAQAATSRTDVIFQAVTGTGAAAQTLDWDLGKLATDDLVSSQFIAKTTGPLTLTNSLLTSYLASISATNLPKMKWRVLGVSEVSGGIDPVTGANLPSPNYGGLITSTKTPAFLGNLDDLAAGFVTPQSNVINVIGADANNTPDGAGNVDDAKTVVGTGTASYASTGSDSRGGSPSVAKLGLGSIDFYYVHRNPAVGGDAFLLDGVQAPNGVLETKLGTWQLSYSAANGATLSYSAVPVPSAVLLLGSAIAGLAGIARRRKV